MTTLKPNRFATLATLGMLLAKRGMRGTSFYVAPTNGVIPTDDDPYATNAKPWLDD